MHFLFVWLPVSWTMQDAPRSREKFMNKETNTEGSRKINCRKTHLWRMVYQTDRTVSMSWISVIVVARNVDHAPKYRLISFGIGTV